MHVFFFVQENEIYSDSTCEETEPALSQLMGAFTGAFLPPEASHSEQ